MRPPPTLPPRLATAAVCTSFSLLCISCFYDHRVTQAILERRQRAKAAEGAELRTNGGSSLPARYVGRVRFYVADDYRRQHPGWRRQLEDLLESANPVLRPAFGVQLQVSELHEWTPACDDSNLDACLEELSQIELREGAEWVVGVVGAQPRFTTSFEELGLANVPGSHFVIRDVSDLAERDAIERAFATHTQTRRDEIYSRRKQHKRVSIFLHEWAHTLGALHTTAAEALLNPAYDDRMSGFDESNAELISVAIEDRFGKDASVGTAPAKEDDVRSHPFLVAGPDDELLGGVQASDRRTYHRAVNLLLEGDASEAFANLVPLAQTCPDNYAIQHFACALSMQQGRQADAQAFCVRMQEVVKARGAAAP